MALIIFDTVFQSHFPKKKFKVVMPTTNQHIFPKQQSSRLADCLVNKCHTFKSQLISNGVTYVILLKKVIILGEWSVDACQPNATAVTAATAAACYINGQIFKIEWNFENCCWALKSFDSPMECENTVGLAKGKGQWWGKMLMDFCRKEGSRKLGGHKVIS